MRNILLVGVSVAAFTTPALAARQPTSQPAPTFIDAAAVAPYQAETPVGALRRPRPRRLISTRHHEARPSRAKPSRRAEATPTYPAPKPLPVSALAPLQATLEEGLVDGVAGPEPVTVTKRPERLTGTLEIEGRSYPYVSGGSGWSIPYGDHRITPEAVGRWGRRHGAIGLADDAIYDHYLRREREGVELHPASAHTAGCVGIVSDWPGFKRAVLHMIDEFGFAYLHVGVHRVSISPVHHVVAVYQLPGSVVERRHVHVADHRRHHHYRHYARA